MKNAINSLLLTVFLLFFTSSCVSKKVNAVNTKNKINQLMDQWHLDAANANFDGYFNRLDGIFIGTDANEIWSKNEFATFCKPFFDKKKTWSFKTKSRNIYFSKNKKTAWFDELLDTWMGECRGSGVLEKVNTTWVIKHYVLSVTIPNDEMNKVVKIKKAVE